MPRSPFVLACLTLLALAPLAHAVTVPSPVHGSATVTKFFVRSDGVSHSVRDGLWPDHLVCTACFLNLTVTGPGLSVYRNGQEWRLEPGVYQFWGFAGSVAYEDVTRHVARFHLEGSATVRYVGPVS